MKQTPRTGSFLDVFRGRAVEHPERPAFTFLRDGETELATWSYRELDTRARSVAARLQAAGDVVGERGLLLFPPGLEFIAAFLGCLYAGVVAVPAYPPRRVRAGRGHAVDERLEVLVRDAAPRFILADAATVARREALAARVPELAGPCWLAVGGAEEEAAAWSEPPLSGEALAFLQYTSGSTADPKGVMVTHANLLHNEEAIRRAFGVSADSVIVGWLPLYHDMGLIGDVLQPLYAGARCVLMSPQAFLQQPLRWLQAISRYRGTTSGGPDFAYELCTRRITEEQKQGLDLASWTVAFNGSEPVRAETLRRFAEAFAPCGFAAGAQLACYGLAESTLFVSGAPLRRAQRVDAYVAAELEAGRAVRATGKAGESAARQLVSCGPVLAGEVVVVDPQARRESGAGRVGEIWLAGPSVARGYWRRREQSERDFAARLDGEPARGPFLRTGDLGFLAGGELFVTGRLKDLIILRGRNHYPQDIERSVERSRPELRPGSSAAFAIEERGEERLVVACEVELRKGAPGPRWEEIAENMVRAVAAEHEIPLHAVVLLAPGTIPRTSSGKIRRQACREAYRAGQLPGIGEWRPEERRLSTVEAEAPRTLVEERLAEIWSEVFQREVGVRDGFFSLGGDSLRAAQILARIDEDFGIELELEDLFAAASLADLARLLEGVAAPRSTPAIPPLVRRPRGWDGSEAPLSFAQRRLWFLHQLDPGSAAYNVAAAARMEGPLSVGALAAALAEIERRHEVLRAVYRVEGSEPVQRVSSHRILPVVELGALPGPLRCGEGDRLAREAARLPFDLARGPVLRTVLLREGEGRSRLILVLHHIAVDGGSFAILLDELAELYLATVDGRPARLPEPAFQYADYAVWQRSWLRTDGVLAPLLAWWRQWLEGAPPGLELPTDHPRPPVMSHRGGHLESRLNAELASGLGELGRQRQATPFVVLLAGFLALFQRYTGEEDLLVGLPVDGRDRVELEPLVGLFHNTLVLRVRAADGPSFEDHLARVAAAVLAIYARRQLPFETLVEAMSPGGRELSRMPLVQVLFVGQNAPLRRLDLPGLTFSPEEVDTGTAQFDLGVSVAPVESGWLAGWRYATDLFDRVTVERMARHFVALLRAAVARPGAAVADLELLNPAERHQLVTAWNDTGRPVASGCLHELVAAQARRAPGRVAVVDGERQVTYRDLALRASRLARHLAGLGVGPEVRVGVALERSIELVVALLGVLEAGGAYVPLDPGYPRERLASLLADAGADVLLIDSDLAERLPAGRGTVVLEPGAFAGEDTGPVAPSLRRALPDSPAYVIYTSGSTGKPKGVIVPHRGVVDRIAWLQEIWDLLESDRLMQKTPCSFDVSVLEIFWPLAAGARLVMAPPGAHQDPAALAGLIREQRISILWFVPSLLQVFLEQPGLAASCRSVRLLISTGEALPAGLRERCFERLPGVALYNLYGPTEASVEATFHPCRPGEDRPVVPIGRPVGRGTVCVVDRDLRPLPLGVPGELCLGGVGLARGYLGRPDLTAERFVPDPLTAEPGARLYRTGDLARWQPRGTVEYLGRLDHQLKVRGFRIEPGEIEAVLASHPGVREAVVVARGGEVGDRRLVAYVVPAGDAPPAAGELRRHLGERLPEHMVPAIYVPLPALPLTASGKVDRRALPTPEAELPVGGRMAPRTPLERHLAGLWEELLGLSGIGLGDNFFELGGNSIQAALLVNRLCRESGEAVRVRELFEAPALGAFAAALERSLPGFALRAGGEEANGGLASSSEPREGPSPLSFAQERLWFLARLDPANPAYNMPAAVHFVGRLRVAVLAAAFAEVSRRHEILRTTFAEVDGVPVQLVAPPAGARLPQVDLAGLPAAARGEELDRLLLAEGSEPFDLARGPLLRTGLFRLGDGEHVLWVTMHHIVSDAWSIGVFMRELSSLYQAGAAGAPSPLPPLPLQYGDYAERQRRGFAAESARHLAYWRQRLAGPLPALELPTDRPRPAIQSFRGGVLAETLPAGETAELRSWSRRQGTTFFLTLLTALTALLQRYTGETDLLVGIPVANRNRDELEGLIGFFVNVVVQRTDAGGAPSFRALLGRVEAGFVASSAHQEMPFEQLVAELQPERDLSRPPFFQVQLSLQNTPSADLELPGLDLRLLQPHNRTAKLDLSVLLGDDPGGLTTALEYSTDLFDAATIGRWLGHWRTLLAGVVADPERSLPELPLLTGPELHQLTQGWNAPLARCADGPPVHRRFEAHADREPGAVAVVCEGVGLSYGELDRRANALAWRLRALGVGPGSLAGLCVDRSLDTVVGILGILKAGGAYVPLDPAFPEERTAWILEDALAAGDRPVVVTQKPLAPRFSALASSPRIVLLDAPEVRAGDAERPVVETSADDLAYVIYTSGSTGRPKGVPVSHGNVVRLFSATCERFRFGNSDVWTLFHSYAFDFSVWEIWGALAWGGRLLVVPRETSRDPAAFHRLLEREGVTVLNQTPSAFRQLVRADELAGERQLQLRLVIFGGEALDLNLLRPWLARHGDARPELVNMYGITETTVHVTWRWLRATDLGRPGGSPVGLPLPDLQVHLLGPAGEIVPVGVVGEIFVGGAGLAWGYLGRPELTAERFVPDPFAARPGLRLYRSGDLARRRQDGDLEYLGRIDHQVQIRGFRVELGEIETVLAGHPSVREAVVVARDAGEGEVWVTAYVVPKEPGLASGELRHHLASRLPDYMIPRSFVSLEALPLTPTGKVDRRALPEPDGGRPRLAPGSAAPRDPLEEVLAGIWSEVLAVGPVGIHDDFFALGGHSLVAARVAARVRGALGVELPLRLLFERPTVAGLASALGGMLRASGSLPDSLRAPIEPLPRPIGGAVPASLAQRRLWFLEQLTPGTALYNLPWLLRLSGDLDAPALARALAGIVERHEALRTTFREDGGEPLQVVGPPEIPPLPQVDLSALAPVLRAAELARGVEAEAARPFDLTAEPLLRAWLFRETPTGESPAGHRLLIVVHHAVADGWSMEILGRELAALYAAFSGAAPAPALDELPFPVRRLLPVAIPPLGAGTPGGSARLLVGGPGGGSHRPRAAGRPSPPRGADGSRRESVAGAPHQRRGRPAAALPARERHPLHVPARRLRRPARAHGRRRGSVGGRARRQPRPAGDRGARRPLRQPAGAARRPRGRSAVSGSAAPGPGDHPRRLRPSGLPLRSAGGGAAPRTRPGAAAAGPGDVRPAPAARRSGGGWAYLRDRGGRQPVGPLRSLLPRPRRRRLVHRRGRLQRRPLRARDDGTPPRPLRAAGAGSGGGARPLPLPAPTGHRG